MNTIEPGSSITPPAGDLVSKEKKQKQSTAPVDIVEQGLKAVKEEREPHKVRRSQSPPPQERSIDVKKSIETVKRTPTHKERDKAVSELFSGIQPHYRDQDRILLLKSLSEGVYGFDKSEHSFRVQDHLAHVTTLNPEKPLTVGFAPIGKKAYFAKGGIGKIYPFFWVDTHLGEAILKLSQKQLKPLDADGKKIPFSKEERAQALITGTTRGEITRGEVENETRMMLNIRKRAQELGLDLTGLNVTVYGRVTIGNQAGLIGKRYDCDGFSFALEQTPPPSAETCFDCMQQLLQGLNTLHDLDLVHRDVKLENVVVKDNGETKAAADGTPYPAYEVAHTDLGGVVYVKDIFAESPYPELAELLGAHTHKFFSLRLKQEIETELESIKNLAPDDDEYADRVLSIQTKLEENDDFALALNLYILWTMKGLPFESFEKETYFELDPLKSGETYASALNAKMAEMHQELVAASWEVSKAETGDQNAVADMIIKGIRFGL